MGENSDTESDVSEGELSDSSSSSSDSSEGSEPLPVAPGSSEQFVVNKLDPLLSSRCVRGCSV